MSRVFDADEYAREVAELRGHELSELVLGDRLFDLAARRKLTASPAVPLTSEEIAGGLSGVIYSHGDNRTLIRERLRLVLPHLTEARRREPDSLARELLMGTVVAAAYFTEDTLSREELDCFAQAVLDWMAESEEYERQDARRKLASFEASAKDGTNPAVAGIGEAVALLRRHGIAVEL